jgi:hypothetical protein
MTKLYPFETKVLRLHLKGLQVADDEITKIIAQSKVIERNEDKIGFHTVVSIPNLDKLPFDNKNGIAISGRTSKGILVGYAIYKFEQSLYGHEKDGSGCLVIDGYTYSDTAQDEDPPYPHDEHDYDVIENPECLINPFS